MIYTYTYIHTYVCISGNRIVHVESVDRSKAHLSARRCTSTELIHTTCEWFIQHVNSSYNVWMIHTTCAHCKTRMNALNVQDAAHLRQLVDALLFDRRPVYVCQPVRMSCVWANLQIAVQTLSQTCVYCIDLAAHTQASACVFEYVHMYVCVYVYIWVHVLAFECVYESTDVLGVTHAHPDHKTTTKLCALRKKR